MGPPMDPTEPPMDPTEPPPTEPPPTMPPTMPPTDPPTMPPTEPPPPPPESCHSDPCTWETKGVCPTDCQEFDGGSHCPPADWLATMKCPPTEACSKKMSDPCALPPDGAPACPTECMDTPEICDGAFTYCAAGPPIDPASMPAEMPEGGSGGANVPMAPMGGSMPE